MPYFFWFNAEWLWEHEKKKFFFLKILIFKFSIFFSPFFLRNESKQIKIHLVILFS